MIRVVVDGHARARLPNHVTRRNAVQVMRRRITVVAGNADCQPIAGTETNAVGANLDVEFVNLIGRQRFALLVDVIRRPRLRATGIDPSLRPETLSPAEFAKLAAQVPDDSSN